MFGYDPEQEERRPAREPHTPAPVKPLLLGVAASFIVYALWGMVGMPLVGVVGGVIAGVGICALLLLRARPAPMEEEDEETLRWGR